MTTFTELTPERLADALARLLTLNDAKDWDALVVRKHATMPVNLQILDLLVIKVFAQMNRQQHEEIKELRARLVALECGVEAALTVGAPV